MKTFLKTPTLYLCICLAICILTACSGSAPAGSSSGSELLPTETKIPATLTSAPSPTVTPTPTPSPTPTLPPPPLEVLVPRLYTIEIAQNNNVPTDLQEFVFNYPGSAGGCGDCCGGNDEPTWSVAYNGAVIPALPQTLRWVAEDFIPSTNTTISFTLPDGSVISSEDSSNMYGCMWFDYDVVPGTPLGEYTLEIRQGETILRDIFSLAMPADPVRIVYEGTEWFAGFEPNEQVTLSLYYLGTLNEFLQPEIAPLFPALPDFSRLFGAYELESYTLNAFLGTQTVTADAYGGFQVQYTSEQLPLTDENYTLGIGDASRITTLAEGEMSGRTSVNKLSGSCYASLPNRLEVGDTAVVTGYVEQCDLYSFFSRVTLEPGTQVTMVMGPFCTTGYAGLVSDQWLWYIDAPGHPAIQVSECDAADYFLEPLEP